MCAHTHTDTDASQALHHSAETAERSCFFMIIKWKWLIASEQTVRPSGPAVTHHAEQKIHSFHIGVTVTIINSGPKFSEGSLLDRNGCWVHRKPAKDASLFRTQALSLALSIHQCTFFCLTSQVTRGGTSVDAEKSAAKSGATTAGPQGQQHKRMTCIRGGSELNWLGIK